MQIKLSINITETMSNYTINVFYLQKWNEYLNQWQQKEKWCKKKKLVAYQFSQPLDHEAGYYK